MGVRVKLISGASRNIAVRVWGELDQDISEPQSIFELKDVMPPADRIKVMSAWWLIQEKMTLLAWWGPEELLFPLESRNSIAFQRGITPPDRWGGHIYLTSEKQATCGGLGRFAFSLEFDR